MARRQFGSGWNQVRALAAFLALEALAFERAASRFQAWIYPRWYDQVQYLTEAYRAYFGVREAGWVAGILRALAAPSPQGKLGTVAVLPFFALGGATRLAALQLNLVAFLALQAATFAAMRRATGRWGPAWLAVGLLAALVNFWSGGAASLVDFRLDPLAACAFGVALAAAIASRGFRSGRGALACGVAVGAAIATRYLTLAYFGPIYLGLAAWIAFGRERPARLARLGLAGAAALAIAGPLLWHNRGALVAYYWVGHVAGPERALRDSHLGIFASIGWIGSRLAQGALGWPWFALAAAALVAVVIGARTDRFRAGEGEPPPLAEPVAVALLFLAVPAAVLAVQPEKSLAPLTIAVGPAVWLAVLAIARAGRRLAPGGLAAVGLGAALAGLALVAGRTAVAPYSEAEAADARKIAALADYVAYRSEESSLAAPRIAVTSTVEGLSPDTLSVLIFERQGRWLFVRQALPSGIFDPQPALVWDQIRGSDFVCLASTPGAAWPFDRRIAAMRPEIAAWCAAHLRRVGEFETEAASVEVFERRDLGAMEGPSRTEWDRVLAADGAGREPKPPAPPRWPPRPGLLGATDAPWAIRLEAAYTPVRYAATGLPPGLALDPESGWIRGKTDWVGEGVVRATATNAAGASTIDLPLRVEAGEFGAGAQGPVSARLGVPVAIGFEAYETGGRLDFIDVVDTTTSRFLERLEANDEERVGWSGHAWVVFDRAGDHAVSLRFVRINPRPGDRYGFIDRTVMVRAEP